jgi:flagellar motor switch protein FliG
VGENGKELIARLRERSSAAPVASLDQVGNGTLAELLVEEHPQTIAAVLAHLPTRRVAEILERLRPEQRLGTIRRIAKIGPVDVRTIRDVVDTLVDRAARAQRRSASGFSLPLAS